MEFEDQEEHEGDVEMGPSYDDDDDDSVLPNSTRSAKMPPSPVAMDAEPQSQRKPTYRECLKNHAVGIGGHAVDGCCEFMAAGAEGTLDALKCAACNCHRNFHRKEANVGGVADHFFHYHHQQQPLLTHYPHRQFSPPYYRTAAPSGYLQVVQPRPLALPSTSGGGGGREDQDDISGGGSKKRFRTKFTQEQKEKMMGLAESLGWRIQKQDEEVVQQFCNEVGLKRHVLKVWMHNNKHTLGKKP